MKPFVIAGMLLLAALSSTSALASLPPPSDEAKAKAAEAAAKSAHAAKVNAYQLCRVQDKVAAAYFAAAKEAGRPTHSPVPTPPCVEPGPFVYNPAQ
jgi:hypothetical protein